MTDQSVHPIAYPLEQAFSMIGVGRSKGYELVSAGELPSYTVGRRRYISREALQSFVSRKQSEAAA